MAKIKVLGKEYGIDELKLSMKNLSEVNIIGALCKDDLSWFYNYQPSTISNLNGLLEAYVSAKDLDEKEIKWFDNVKKLKEKLISFDNNYKKCDKTTQDKYLRNFTKECALILENIVEGSYNYYVMCSKTIYAKNEKGIESPLNLNIVD
jgi:hypothetical protein